MQVAVDHQCPPFAVEDLASDDAGGRAIAVEPWSREPGIEVVRGVDRVPVDRRVTQDHAEMTFVWQARVDVTYRSKELFIDRDIPERVRLGVMRQPANARTAIASASGCRYLDSVRRSIVERRGPVSRVDLARMRSGLSRNKR
jgi:hypothetical protein